MVPGLTQYLAPFKLWLMSHIPVIPKPGTLSPASSVHMATQPMCSPEPCKLWEGQIPGCRLRIKRGGTALMKYPVTHDPLCFPSTEWHDMAETTGVLMEITLRASSRLSRCSTHGAISLGHDFHCLALLSLFWYGLFSYLFCEKFSLVAQLAWNLPCKSCWPPIHRDSPTSASRCWPSRLVFTLDL